MVVEKLITKRCTSKKVHGEHKWWSRRQHCYFRCHGRSE